MRKAAFGAHYEDRGLKPYGGTLFSGWGICPGASAYAALSSGNADERVAERANHVDVSRDRHTHITLEEPLLR